MKTLTADWLTIKELDELLLSSAQIQLSEELKKSIVHCREYLDEVSAKNERMIYGVNTGFGSLCNTAISVEDLGKLQENLILSHACGMGERVPDELVKV